MTEATTAKSKPAKSAPVVPLYEMPKFEIPSFEMPKFDMPKLEIPAAFREFAEKGVAQAKDSYEKLKSAAEETTVTLETVYSSATKGSTDYGHKVIEIARANTNAGFDYAVSLLGAKSLSELVEISTTHSRQQFEAFHAQAKELTALAQKVATETAEPIKSGVTKAFNKVA